MNFLEIILLALALAMDAFVVSFSYGLIMKRHRLGNALRLGTTTGCGQFLMPVIGFALISGAYRNESLRGIIESWDHWIAFGVFLLLGLKVIQESRNSSDDEDDIRNESSGLISIATLFAIGIATSIDALVAGGSIFLLSTQPCLTPGQSAALSLFPAASLIPATVIGLVTFMCAVTGFLSAGYLHRLPTRLLGILAGLVLIGIGTRILWEHTC